MSDPSLKDKKTKAPCGLRPSSSLFVPTSSNNFNITAFTLIFLSIKDVWKVQQLDNQHVRNIYLAKAKERTETSARNGQNTYVT